MPKLSKDVAKKVDEAGGGDFEVLPEGPYAATLVKVEVKEGAKAPYWSWEYSLDDHPGRKAWNNTSLSEAALWKVNETFTAFGVPTTTDTDDLVGKQVTLILTIGTIQAGPRAGEQRNEVAEVRPASMGAAAGASKKASSLPF